MGNWASRVWKDRSCVYAGHAGRIYITPTILEEQKLNPKA